MLSPDSRRLYTDCFRAPPGGTFDCAVGTTFTLDFEALLYVPLALACSGFDDPVAALREPVALLQGINRVSERLTVFCQDGYSNTPEIHHPLLSLLEDSYAPASARTPSGIFHPKLWLIRFTDPEDGSSLLRAVVLSRNLTTSRCWDTLVCLEGTPRPQKSVPESAGLAKLVAALPQLMTGAKLSAARLAQVAALAAEAARTEFFAPPPFDEATRVEFVALGLGDKVRWAPQPGERVLGISPFVGDGALRKLAALAPASRTLISREESLEALSPDTLADWHALHLIDTAGAEADSAQHDADGDTADSLPHGLHAKALVIDAGKHTTWWLGSANLTDAAINGPNVELLIKLEGARKHVGIDAFLGGFDNFLRPFAAPTTPLPLTDDDAAGKLAEQARHAVVHAQLSGTCIQDAEHGWSLQLHGGWSLPKGVRVEAWLLTLPDATALPWSAGGVTFKGLAVESLTAFVAFRVEATVGAETHRLAFTRKLPVEGFPEDRRQHILRSVIRDKDAFLSYLRRVLAGIEGDALQRPDGADDPFAGPTTDAQRATAPLLESMLRAMRRDPESLAAIDKTVHDLRSDARDAVVPADFLQVWDMLRAVMLARRADGTDRDATPAQRPRGRS